MTNGVLIEKDKNILKSFERGLLKYKLQGIITVFFLDGSVFDGNWEKNRRHGKGKEYYLNGDKYQGNWDNNKRMSETPNRQIRDKFEGNG